MSEVLADWRCAVAPARTAAPAWFLFSLPDALWVYALTVLLSLIWREARGTWASRIWIATGAVLGCGGEVLQKLGFVPGTYDLADLLLSVIAAAAAVVRISFDTNIREETPWFDTLRVSSRF
jgi:hypothetical protein